MNTKKLFLFVFVMVLLAACQPAGPSAKDLAATAVVNAAETAAAAPPTVTQTPVPTDTPLPTPTITGTPEPTLTPTPSGPLMIKDDFSSKSDIWAKCSKCEWKDGKLYYGPFDPNGQGINQLFPLICKACGEQTYFRIAADVAFFSGFGGDRFFGVGGVIPDKFFTGASITTTQFGTIEVFDFTTLQGVQSKIGRYGVIKPVTGVNRVEFQAKPNGSGGLDYYEIVNGSTINVLYSQQVLSLQPALYVSWHSVGVTFDNFEFEELVP